jgi:hypothetical protein
MKLFMPVVVVSPLVEVVSVGEFAESLAMVDAQLLGYLSEFRVRWFTETWFRALVPCPWVLKTFGRTFDVLLLPCLVPVLGYSVFSCAFGGERSWALFKGGLDPS